MSTSSNHRASRPQPKTAEETAIGNRSALASFVSGVLGVISTLFFSMLFSVVVAIVGVTYFWPDEGAEHERKTLATELNALAKELSEVGLGLTNFVAELILESRSSWWGGQFLSEFVEWCAQFITPKAAMYGEVVSLSMQIFVVRVGVILSSLPVIGYWVLLGVICGLTERDLRRFNAALESSTTFNLAYQHVQIPFIFCIALYLSWPTQAYAVLAMVPVCIGSFLMFYLAIAHYKKRL